MTIISVQSLLFSNYYTALWVMKNISYFFQRGNDARLSLPYLYFRGKCLNELQSRVPLVRTFTARAPPCYLHRINSSLFPSHSTEKTEILPRQLLLLLLLFHGTNSLEDASLPTTSLSTSLFFKIWVSYAITVTSLRCYLMALGPCITCNTV